MAEESRQEGFLGRIFSPRKEASIAKERIGPFVCVNVKKFHRPFIIFGLAEMPSLLDFSVAGGGAAAEIRPSGAGSRALSQLDGKTVAVLKDEVLIRSGAHNHGFFGIYGLDETGEGIVELKPGQKPGERAGFDIKPNEMVIAVPVYLEGKRGLFVCGGSRYREHKEDLKRRFDTTDRNGLIKEMNEAREAESAKWGSFWQPE